MAKNDATKQTDAALRENFRNMDADTAQEIRESYYRVVENLHSLAELLEIEDAKQPQTAGPLLDEHFRAVAAIEAMKDSRLGAVL